MGYPVTWFEIYSPNANQSVKFYTELFGWSVQSMPEMNYHLIDTNAGEGINGGIGQTQGEQPPGLTFYAEGEDIQALLDRAVSLGSTVMMPVTTIPDMVTFAIVADPFGNALGLVQGDGSTRIGEGDHPAVGWFELLVSDPAKAWAFYEELLGWSFTKTEGEGFTYGEVNTNAGGQGISGGIGSSPDGQPHVNIYAGVDDLQKYLERAESLGASTIMGPMEVSEGQQIAMFADPQGVTFGMYLHAHPH
jgi:uncharacterized protein